MSLIRLTIESAVTMAVVLTVAYGLVNLWNIAVRQYEYQPCGCVAEPSGDGLRFVHYCPGHLGRIQ